MVVQIFPSLYCLLFHLAYTVLGSITCFGVVVLGKLIKSIDILLCDFMSCFRLFVLNF